MSNRNTIERAFELARSGKYQSIQDVERQLRSEQYEAVLQHLQGPSIRKELDTTVRYLGVEVEDALALAEGTDV